MYRAWPAVLCLTGALLSVEARATSDGFIDYAIPYFHPQSGDICLRRLPMLAEFGMPATEMLRGTLAPAQVFASAPKPEYLNINLVGTAPALVGTVKSDALLESGIWDFSMSLDLRALNESNGNTVEGRSATVQAAKLFLLAMAENMASLGMRGWRLRVEFVGLPDQRGLPGTVLPANTLWAYSAQSVVLASIKRELINVTGSCQ